MKLKTMGMLAAIMGASASVPGASMLGAASFDGVGVTVEPHKIPVFHNGKRIRRPKSAKRLRLRRTRGWR